MDVAQSIVEHSGELNPDLIVMCSHGRGGLKRMVTGSIAYRVIGMGKVPILLVQPEQTSTLAPDFQKIMLPLDLSARHESVMDQTGELARKLNASLHLLTVVPTYGTLTGKQAASSRLLPGTAAVMLEMDEIGAKEHLQELAGSGNMSGLHLRLEVRRGDPAAEITRAAVDAGDGLIVLGTHGKAGMDAFWAGSVAPKVASQTTLPLLLINVKKEK
jgi:nucleotide-binding universal stress UspA family protein